MNRRKLFFGAAATSLEPFALGRSAQAEALPYDGVDYFTNVEVQTHDGRTLRFYDDVMKGKILLIDEVLTPDSSRFWAADMYEPGHAQPRRRTRLRPVRPSRQLSLLSDIEAPPNFVSDYEVRAVLETVEAEA